MSRDNYNEDRRGWRSYSNGGYHHQHGRSGGRQGRIMHHTHDVPHPYRNEHPQMSRYDHGAGMHTAWPPDPYNQQHPMAQPLPASAATANGYDAMMPASMGPWASQAQAYPQPDPYAQQMYMGHASNGYSSGSSYGASYGAQYGLFSPPAYQSPPTTLPAAGIQPQPPQPPRPPPMPPSSNPISPAAVPSVTAAPPLPSSPPDEGEIPMISSPQHEQEAKLVSPPRHTPEVKHQEGQLASGSSQQPINGAKDAEHAAAQQGEQGDAVGRPDGKHITGNVQMVDSPSTFKGSAANRPPATIKSAAFHSKPTSVKANRPIVAGKKSTPAATPPHTQAPTTSSQAVQLSGERTTPSTHSHTVASNEKQQPAGGSFHAGGTPADPKAAASGLETGEIQPQPAGATPTKQRQRKRWGPEVTNTALSDTVAGSGQETERSKLQENGEQKQQTTMLASAKAYPPTVAAVATTASVNIVGVKPELDSPPRFEQQPTEAHATPSCAFPGLVVHKQEQVQPDSMHHAQQRAGIAAVDTTVGAQPSSDSPPRFKQEATEHISSSAPQGVDARHGSAVNQAELSQLNSREHAEQKGEYYSRGNRSHSQSRSRSSSRSRRHRTSSPRLYENDRKTSMHSISRSRSRSRSRDRHHKRSHTRSRSPMRDNGRLTQRMADKRYSPRRRSSPDRRYDRWEPRPRNRQDDRYGRRRYDDRYDSSRRNDRDWNRSGTRRGEEGRGYSSYSSYRTRSPESPGRRSDPRRLHDSSKEVKELDDISSSLQLPPSPPHAIHGITASPTAALGQGLAANQPDALGFGHQPPALPEQLPEEGLHVWNTHDNDLQENQGHHPIAPLPPHSPSDVRALKDGIWTRFSTRLYPKFFPDDAAAGKPVDARTTDSLLVAMFSAMTHEFDNKPVFVPDPDDAPVQLWTDLPEETAGQAAADPNTDVAGEHVLTDETREIPLQAAAGLNGMPRDPRPPPPPPPPPLPDGTHVPRQAGSAEIPQLCYIIQPPMLLLTRQQLNMLEMLRTEQLAEADQMIGEGSAAAAGKQGTCRGLHVDPVALTAQRKNEAIKDINVEEEEWHYMLLERGKLIESQQLYSIKQLQQQAAQLKLTNHTLIVRTSDKLKLPLGTTVQSRKDLYWSGAEQRPPPPPPPLRLQHPQALSAGHTSTTNQQRKKHSQAHGTVLEHKRKTSESLLHNILEESNSLAATTASKEQAKPKSELAADGSQSRPEQPARALPVKQGVSAVQQSGKPSAIKSTLAGARQINGILQTKLQLQPLSELLKLTTPSSQSTGSGSYTQMCYQIESSVHKAGLDKHAGQQKPDVSKQAAQKNDKTATQTQPKQPQDAGTQQDTHMADADNTQQEQEVVLWGPPPPPHHAAAVRYELASGICNQATAIARTLLSETFDAWLADRLNMQQQKPAAEQAAMNANSMPSDVAVATTPTASTQQQQQAVVSLASPDMVRGISPPLARTPSITKRDSAIPSLAYDSANRAGKANEAADKPQYLDDHLGDDDLFKGYDDTLHSRGSRSMSRVQSQNQLHSSNGDDSRKRSATPAPVESMADLSYQQPSGRSPSSATLPSPPPFVGNAIAAPSNTSSAPAEAAPTAAAAAAEPSSADKSYVPTQPEKNAEQPSETAATGQDINGTDELKHVVPATQRNDSLLSDMDMDVDDDQHHHQPPASLMKQAEDTASHATHDTHNPADKPSAPQDAPAVPVVELPPPPPPPPPMPSAPPPPASSSPCSVVAAPPQAEANINIPPGSDTQPAGVEPSPFADAKSPDQPPCKAQEEEPQQGGSTAGRRRSIARQGSSRQYLGKRKSSSSAFNDGVTDVLVDVSNPAGLESQGDLLAAGLPPDELAFQVEQQRIREEQLATSFRDHLLQVVSKLKCDRNIKDTFWQPVVQQYPSIKQEYLAVIHQPMDLQTVKHNIDKGDVYSVSQEGCQAFIAHLQLIATNCIQFQQQLDSGPDADYMAVAHDMMQKVDKETKELWKRVIDDAALVQIKKPRNR